jgi:hypothetical protein
MVTGESPVHDGKFEVLVPTGSVTCPFGLSLQLYGSGRLLLCLFVPNPDTQHRTILSLFHIESSTPNQHCTILLSLSWLYVLLLLQGGRSAAYTPIEAPSVKEAPKNTAVVATSNKQFQLHSYVRLPLLEASGAFRFPAKNVSDFIALFAIRPNSSE